MEIPYEVSARPDTGLYNAKFGMWLFLASEVMLFGGLFSGYIFLRLGADPGYWPHGLLNVPVGTFNTIILVISSMTVVVAWAALKLRQWGKYKLYMAITILLSILFLIIKLTVEWPQKFEHFGAFIKPEAAAKYEKYFGNERLAKVGLPPRHEITGHLHEVEAEKDGKTEEVKVASWGDVTKLEAAGSKIVGYKVGVDPTYADPNNPAHDHPAFLYPTPTETVATIEAEDVDTIAGPFYPSHSPYLAVYFTITGLHGLHVLGGIVVFSYFWLFGHKLYRKNPEHMANRVEVAGLYWHFVDLLWIMVVFPVFYLF
ncbi:MAG: cytochrome c oxidase subunit 3 [Chthoniobacteraceae bacterium]